MIQDIKQSIIAVCQKLHAKNMLASADGNVSYRLDSGEIVMTPTGLAKANMQVADVATLTLNGEIVSGKPSSERLMHLTVFKNCPEAKAVVHAHPPHAIAWSIARPDLKFLPDDCMSELILATGGIPFVPYARPSTQKMGDNLLPFLPRYRAMILSRHGALTWGETLEEAYNGMERLEHAAMILHLAQQLGGITSLAPDEVEALRLMRQTLGPKLL